MGKEVLLSALANDCVRAVLKNLDDRSGFDHWFDSIDEEIQAEIRESLRNDVQAVLAEAVGFAEDE